MRKEASPHTGTTIVAVTYPGGVVLGADGRVSTGTYISNRASNKITPLTDTTYLLRSGSACDTEAIGDYVNYYLGNLEAEVGRVPTVKSAATLVRQINFNNKHLIGATIIAGWDACEGGQVYAVPIGGAFSREQWAVEGSGSTFIWGYVDAGYRSDFSREQAENFVKEAIALALSTDSSSGGIIRLVTISKDGTKHQYFPGELVPKFCESEVDQTCVEAMA